MMVMAPLLLPHHQLMLVLLMSLQPPWVQLTLLMLLLMMALPLPQQ
jgi:hypothetical protein